MRCHRFAILMFLFAFNVAAPNIAAAQELDGNWRGDGLIRPKNFDEEQKVRCRVKGSSNAKGENILLGRCATANRSGGFRLEISNASNEKAVQATMQIIGSNRKFRFSGRKTGSGYALNSTRPILQHGRKIASRFTVSKSNQETMLIREVITDLATGKKVEPLNLTFKRKPDE